MPNAPERPCLHPLCGNYAVEHGRCHDHQPDFNRLRGKTAERGYDAAWRRFRAWFLRRHPFCEDCGRMATEVHHIEKIEKRPDLRLVESNCKALCQKCHAVRTRRGE